jgi:hypothetical protein
MGFHRRQGHRTIACVVLSRTPIDKDDKDITYVNFSDFVGNATTQKEKDLLTYKKRTDYADDAEPHG